MEMQVDVVIAEGIAQQRHLHFRRQIVVKRESATVGNAITARIKPHLCYEPVDYGSSVRSLRRTVASGGCKLIEHRLGIEIVALLEHLHQHLVDGMESADNAEGVVGSLALGDIGFHHDAGFG